MKYALGLVAILSLTACASGGQSSDCAYRNLVGKSVYSPEVDAVRSKGLEVRLLYPDSYLGFEKKPNRVNVIRDDSNEILAVTCG